MRALSLLLLLSGCATWEKPGATEADFYRDQYACQIAAAPAQDGVLFGMLRDRCMRLKGWK